MKIAVPTAENNQHARPEERFGRARGFMVYDSDNKSWTHIDNVQNYNAAQGAGIQSASHLVEAAVNAVCCPNLGPKAYAVLNQAGVAMYMLQDGTIQENVEACIAKKLKPMSSANQEGHW